MGRQRLQRLPTLDPKPRIGVVVITRELAHSSNVRTSLRIIPPQVMTLTTCKWQEGRVLMDPFPASACNCGMVELFSADSQREPKGQYNGSNGG